MFTGYFTIGVVAVIWATAWFILISETPETHPRITLSEKLFIRSDEATGELLRERSIPWYLVLISALFSRSKMLVEEIYLSAASL